jgi:hypothetical protein
MPDVVIRRADPEADFDRVLTGARAFAALVNRPDVLPAPDSPALERAIRTLMGLPITAVLLAEVDGRTVGGIGLLVTPSLWDATRIACEELFWWCANDAPPSAAMRLLRVAKEHGKAAGATLFTFHRLTTSPPGVDLAYRRMGTQPMQVTYVGEG